MTTTEIIAQIATIASLADALSVLSYITFGFMVGAKEIMENETEFFDMIANKMFEIGEFDSFMEQYPARCRMFLRKAGFTWDEIESAYGKVKRW